MSFPNFADKHGHGAVFLPQDAIDRSLHAAGWRGRRDSMIGLLETAIGVLVAR